ncbi:MAG: hypothetical protein FWH12_09475 [Treponema sp.]|nr:hypothetical protein [Treponema sp.]
MRRPSLFVFIFILLFSILGPSPPLDAYIVTYKEQYYRLFHQHLNQYPDETMENIYWLEQALKAPFANPLWAMALIEDETQWEKYRYLFMMHINLHLAEQHMFLGNKWNKRHAYFYNAPFREAILESLEIAETCFRTALYYWEEAQHWAALANERRFRWINLQRIQFWEDQAFRIENGRLNYGRTVQRELTQLQSVREAFLAMDDSTY